MPHSIEVVHGNVGPALADELLAFWLAHGALDERTGSERLPLVAAVVRDDAGAIAGTASATPAAVELVAGRRFYVLRSFLAPGTAAGDPSVRPAVERAVHAALDPGTDRSDDDPLGICLLLSPEQAAQRPADAQWSHPPFLYAGTLPDGSHVRIAWFAEPISVVPGIPPATAEPVWRREDGPRIDVFDAQDAVTREDVIAFWLAESALSDEAARSRAEEIVLVAMGDRGEIAGVATAGLGHNERLATDMWHARVFVGREHRGSMLGLGLVVVVREELERRWAAGEDRRAPGVLLEILRSLLPHLLHNAHWRPHDFWFIGENARGDHLRVHWFAGASAPAPAVQVAQGRT